jgi:AcrR family transcriptional regulator
MVQKSSRPRGRPKAYDPATALTQVRDQFWDAGYAGTSLDDLCAATGMNRPSLYSAFGDKHALYLRALADYRDASSATLEKVLSTSATLRQALTAVYEIAINIYTSGPNGQRGCLLVCTASVAAVTDPEARELFDSSLRSFDAAFEARIARAQEEGEVPKTMSAAGLACVTSAVLHTLSLRARGGAERAELERIAGDGVRLICGEEEGRK